MKRIVVGILMLCLCASVLVAQDLAKRMTNKDVLDMVSLGLAEDVIQEKIRTAEATAFDTSIDSLKALKEAKVPDGVIKLMINPKAGAPAAAAAAAMVDDPSLPPKEVGVYWQNDKKWVELDGQNVSQAKMGGRWASFGTMGIKAKHWNAYLPNPQARAKVTTRHPVFFIYVLEGNSAADYTMLKLDKKDDRRQFEVGSVGGLVGGKSGVRDSNMREFTAEKVAPRTFKVTLKADLEPGEYGFFLATGQQMTTNGKEAAGNTQGRIYDFSIIE